MAVQLQSRFLTTLVVAGRPVGTFQTFTGGGVGGEAAPSRVPGAEFSRQPAGEKELRPITISRDFDPAVDTDELLAFVRQQVMVEDAATVSRKPLDKNRAPFGKGRTWVGLITDVNEPESDVNTTNSKAVLQITIQPSGSN